MAMILYGIINISKNRPVACTADAKICPDGTGVGRSAPSCEFDPCPVSKICEDNQDCVVFGKEGDCDCGCYNKNALPGISDEKCFCASPLSCECLNNVCEGVF